MSEKPLTERSWVVDLLPEEVRLRCSFSRRGKKLEQFTVQLELKVGEKWEPIVRYDNAHGFCHRDTLHGNGPLEKTAMFVGDLNETFTYAIADLISTWEGHRTRFLGELQS